MTVEASVIDTVDLTPIQRSALHRTAMRNGDLTPVARLFASELERRTLVRIVPTSRHDLALKRISRVEVWCVITPRGRLLDAALQEEMRVGGDARGH
jgi:hypothetical protein